MPSARRIDDYIAPGSRGRGPPGQQGDREAGCPEELLARVAERAAEKVTALYLTKLLDEIDALRREVDALRSEVQRLARAVARSHQRRGSQGDAGGRRKGSGLAELLSKEGYILGGEARARLGYGPARLQSEAEELGAVVVELDGDLAIVDRRIFEEFLAELASVDTPDPNEAARRLGRFERLFNELRRSGRVYFDARRGYWRLL